MCPRNCLLRRPDIAVAERQMAAANAVIGVEQANYFPAITLTGSYGFLSTAASTLFDSASMSHSIAGSLSQTLLDFGGRRAQVDQARNAYAQAVASYRQSVLTAFQDVENDLAAANIYQKEFDLRSKNSEAADLTEQLTLNQYKAVRWISPRWWSNRPRRSVHVCNWRRCGSPDRPMRSR